MLKRELIFAIVLVVFASANAQNGYMPTDMYARYRGLKVDSSLHSPAGPTPRLSAKAYTGPGALYFSTTDSAGYDWTGYNFYRRAYARDTADWMATKTFVLENSAGGLSGGNLGAGWRWYDPEQQALRTFVPGTALLFDTASAGELRAAVDTSLMATRAWRQKGVDSLLGVIAQPRNRFGAEDNSFSTMRRVTGTGANAADRMMRFDSIGLAFEVKANSPADTIISIRQAGAQRFLVDRLGTTYAGAFRTTAGNFVINSSSFAQTSSEFRFITGSSITAYQLPLTMRRSYPILGVDSLRAVLILSNDTLRGPPSNPALDSSNHRLIVGKYRSWYDNIERTQWIQYGDGGAAFNEQATSSAFLRFKGTTTTLLYATAGGNRIGIGTTSPDASAILDISSVSKGFLPPRMSTSERDAIASPATGLQIFNTSTNKPNFYSGSTWVEVGTGSGSGTNNANIGSGYRLLKPAGQEIKTLNAGYGIEIDSTTATDEITFKSTGPNYTVQTLTDGATITWDVSQGVNSVVTLAGTGRTLSITNPTAGHYYTIRIIQDGGGSKTISTWPTNTKWPGGIGPALTTTGGRYDIVTFYYDGTNYYGTYQLDFQ